MWREEDSAQIWKEEEEEEEEEEETRMLDSAESSYLNFLL
jgi:hypothetical protein